jgi:leucyl/phenylalanyl-tRNA--protein transferase
VRLTGDLPAGKTMAIDIRMAQIGRLFSEGVEDEPPCSRADLRRRREALLSETIPARLGRRAGVAAQCLRPSNWPDLAVAADCLLREKLIKPQGLPDPARALSRPDGLCGLAVEVSAEHLAEAYSAGLAPREMFGMCAWWSPSYRMIVTPEYAKVPQSARAHMHRGDLAIVLDRDFDEVIAACSSAARARFDGSAPTGRLMKAFAALHEAGLAHCFAVRAGGELVAGGYGVGAGSVFVSEATFGRRDTLDTGLAILNRHLAGWGYTMHDGKTDLSFEQFGGRATPRPHYLEHLATHLRGGRNGRWSVDRALVGPALHGGR